MLKRLLELEADVEYRSPPGPGEAEFCYAPGSLPVLLSAPHGAAHTRNGRMKEEDEFTAGFSRLVAELSGAHALYARRMSATDPNYYPDTPYKSLLKEIVRQQGIRFVMDIHGASSQHGFGIALGTMSQQSCAGQYRKILETLEAYGFAPAEKGLQRLDVDQRFTGAGGRRQETITRYSFHRLGVSAAQFELSPHLRIVQLQPSSRSPQPFTGDGEMILKTLQAFTHLVKVIGKP